jgi:hypothetical protein
MDHIPIWWDLKKAPPRRFHDGREVSALARVQEGAPGRTLPLRDGVKSS